MLMLLPGVVGVYGQTKRNLSVGLIVKVEKFEYWITVSVHNLCPSLSSVSVTQSLPSCDVSVEREHPCLSLQYPRQCACQR